MRPHLLKCLEKQDISMFPIQRVSVESKVLNLLLPTHSTKCQYDSVQSCKEWYDGLCFQTKLWQIQKHTGTALAAELYSYSYHKVTLLFSSYMYLLSLCFTTLLLILRSRTTLPLPLGVVFRQLNVRGIFRCCSVPFHGGGPKFLLQCVYLSSDTGEDRGLKPMGTRINLPTIKTQQHMSDLHTGTA